jgi:hypothetical protein
MNKSKVVDHLYCGSSRYRIPCGTAKHLTTLYDQIWSQAFAAIYYEVCRCSVQLSWTAVKLCPQVLVYKLGILWQSRGH